MVVTARHASDHLSWRRRTTDGLLPAKSGRPPSDPDSGHSDGTVSFTPRCHMDSISPICRLLRIFPSCYFIYGWFLIMISNLNSNLFGIPILCGGTATRKQVKHHPTSLHIMMKSTPPLLNIDSAFSPLTLPEITAEIIEARISMLAFKNFDSIEKRLPFVLDLCTHQPRFWQELLIECLDAYSLEREREWVLVFPATVDCGYIRTYRFQPSKSAISPEQYCKCTRKVKDAETLYGILNTADALASFNRWYAAKTKATELPTEFVNGRLANTSVARAMILSRGDGCVMCGEEAHCYAATTFGGINQAMMVQLPVCRDHLEEAKRHPSIFSFIASLFHMSIDWGHLEKSTDISDDLIPFVHSTVATELLGKMAGTEKRERGWHLWIELGSGWKWLLRIGSLTDYAYMLYEPGVKKERYRADSAPDHHDLKFFPIHQHSAPGKKTDEVSPSFLYGLPLFDVKRLLDVGRKIGAYAGSDA